jgi:N-acetyl-gamma-glutamyl-phosphate reductase
MNGGRVASARPIANTGCRPIAVPSGFLPMIEVWASAASRLFAVAKAGIDGAGRKADENNRRSEASGDVKAYDVPEYGHLAESVQRLSRHEGRERRRTFVSQLMQVIGRIHATRYAKLIKETDLQALYDNPHATEALANSFVPDSHTRTGLVAGTNCCRIAVNRIGGLAGEGILLLMNRPMKRLALQATQSVKLRFWLPESAGIQHVNPLP